ncbi:MAG: transcriptional regulator [Dictyoglomus sp. NZ13-RE01]|nr:MAG: transcriptional regulator [Dictyoglomus sp. NZ13-RE01]
MKDPLYSLFKDVLREHFIRREMLLGKVKLFRGQAPVLLLLSERDGITQKEIAYELKIKPSTLNLILRRLEKRGYIVKRRDEKDKRFTKIYITEEGKNLVCKLKSIFETLSQDCFGILNEEERRFLEEVFIKIRENLRRLNEEGDGKKCGKF